MPTMGKLWEAIRDKTRDNICLALQSMGMDAQLAEHERIEEKIDSVFLGSSRGIIDISKGPIRWVNVVLGHSWTVNEEGPYFIKCGIPDSRIGPDFPRVRIKSVRKKRFPLFGSVVDLYWKGNDFGLGIISRLNGDISLKPPLIKSNDVKISAHFCHGQDQGCREISTKMRDIPYESLWNCYLKIADYLLETKLDNT